MTAIRIGTRGSALALWQARHVAALLAGLAPGSQLTLVEIVSTGDQVTDLPLADVEGTGFFTATLEHALLAGKVDVAVHSHKDLPVAATPPPYIPLPRNSSACGSTTSMQASTRSAGSVVSWAVALATSQP